MNLGHYLETVEQGFLGIATTIPPEDFDFFYDWDNSIIAGVRVPTKSGRRGVTSDELKVLISIYSEQTPDTRTVESFSFRHQGLDPIPLRDIDGELMIEFFEQYDEERPHYTSPLHYTDLAKDLWDRLSYGNTIGMTPEIVEDLSLPITFRLNYNDGVQDLFTNKKGVEYGYNEIASFFDIGGSGYISELEKNGELQVRNTYQYSRMLYPDQIAEISEVPIPRQIECSNGEMGQVLNFGVSYVPDNMIFKVTDWFRGSYVEFRPIGLFGYPVIYQAEIECGDQEVEDKKTWNIAFTVNNTMSTGEGDNPSATIAAVEYILTKAMEKANDENQLPSAINFTAIGGEGQGRDRVYKIFARKIAREWDYDIESDSGYFVLTR